MILPLPLMSSTWSALVIDDDPGIRQSLRLCLEKDGARVRGVGTPSGALKVLDRGRFDVVLLDQWLQSKFGLVLLPELLRLQPDSARAVGEPSSISTSRRRFPDRIRDRYWRCGG